MVCGAPILCPDLASHFFCHVLGAWPHHVRSPGVPPRGLTEHSHPQHAHLPPHPYLSHPAFYSPIPHPSMLYPYMAHPYPPPSAPLPESPSRKRTGSEETQNSRSKRKRLNARDAVESERSAICHWQMYLASRDFYHSKWVAARLYRE
jgi:hypothetical protein